MLETALSPDCGLDKTKPDHFKHALNKITAPHFKSIDKSTLNGMNATNDDVTTRANYVGIPCVCARGTTTWQHACAYGGACEHTFNHQRNVLHRRRASKCFASECQPTEPVRGNADDESFRPWRMERENRWMASFGGVCVLKKQGPFDMAPNMDFRKSSSSGTGDTNARTIWCTNRHYWPTGFISKEEWMVEFASCKTACRFIQREIEAL